MHNKSIVNCWAQFVKADLRRFAIRSLAFNINGVAYPKNIANRLTNICHLHREGDANSVGTGASFRCGSFVRFYLSIETESSTIDKVTFRSNGCGYMAAGADILAESLTSRRLADLHGLTDAELSELIHHELGDVPAARRECIDAGIQALRSAFAAFRAARIEEFAGEQALICTCFGITEGRIERVIRETGAVSVEDVSAECNAGLGCGSCRMMIEEMIDSRMR